MSRNVSDVLSMDCGRVCPAKQNASIAEAFALFLLDQFPACSKPSDESSRFLDSRRVRSGSLEMTTFSDARVKLLAKVTGAFRCACRDRSGATSCSVGG